MEYDDIAQFLLQLLIYSYIPFLHLHHYLKQNLSRSVEGGPPHDIRSGCQVVWLGGGGRRVMVLAGVRLLPLPAKRQGSLGRASACWQAGPRLQATAGITKGWRVGSVRWVTVGTVQWVTLTVGHCLKVFSTIQGKPMAWHFCNFSSKALQWL